MKETDPHPYPVSISAVGQDSHRFLAEDDPRAKGRPLVLGGLILEGHPPLDGNSDADVVLHALTNALSGLCGQPILGEAADALCRQGLTDSRHYLDLALACLGSIRLTHLSFSIEAKKPILAPFLDPMRRKIASMTGLPVERVALTATSGEGLTAFGQGLGIACICIASALLTAP